MARNPESARDALLIEQRLANGLDSAEDGKCWEWVRASSRGYGQLGVAGKLAHAHRLAYELACGIIPTGLFVLHSCDNPPCINPEHLHLGTASDNIRECVERGRFSRNTARGELHYSAKLTKSDVREIVRLNHLGVSIKTLSIKYGIHKANIRLIVMRRIWASVDAVKDYGNCI